MRLIGSCVLEYVFFYYFDEDIKIMDDDIFFVMCDLNIVVVICLGEDRKERKYVNLVMVDVFFKKEGEWIFFCFSEIY